MACSSAVLPLRLRVEAGVHSVGCALGGSCSHRLAIRTLVIIVYGGLWSKGEMNAGKLLRALALCGSQRAVRRLNE